MSREAIACRTSPEFSKLLHTVGGRLCSSRRGLIAAVPLAPPSARQALRALPAAPLPPSVWQLLPQSQSRC